MQTLRALRVQMTKLQIIGLKHSGATAYLYSIREEIGKTMRGTGFELLSVDPWRFSLGKSPKTKTVHRYSRSLGGISRSRRARPEGRRGFENGGEGNANACLLLLARGSRVIGPLYGQKELVPDPGPLPSDV